MASDRPNRRDAAIRCTQLNSSILNTRRGVPGPLPPPENRNRPPLPVPRQPLEACVFCQNNIDIDHDEIEMCKHCLAAGHHDCATWAIGPNDRQCRDLCGCQYPAPAAIHPHCPGCQRIFRLDDQEVRHRWLDVFDTYAWNTYINRRRGLMSRYPHQMVPSIGGNNPYFDMVYQPEDFQFVRECMVQDMQTIPRTEFITNPWTMRWSSTWNNGAGAPFRLDQATYYLCQQKILGIAQRTDPVFRGRWFPVHASRPALDEDDPNQIYMLSELIYLMHSDKPVWKRFCKMFDNQRLNLAQL